CRGFGSWTRRREITRGIVSSRECLRRIEDDEAWRADWTADARGTREISSEIEVINVSSAFCSRARPTDQRDVGNIFRTALESANLLLISLRHEHSSLRPFCRRVPCHHYLFRRRAGTVLRNSQTDPARTPLGCR